MRTKTVAYTIRIKEDQERAIEQARDKGHTLSALLLMGAEIANGKEAPHK